MIIPSFSNIINFTLLSSRAIHQDFIALDSNLPTAQERYRPVVIWHGLGDHYNSTGIHKVADLFNRYYPGIEVYSISLDEIPSNDQQLSMFGDANIQLQQVCDKMKTIPNISSGFDGIGFSQGGLFLRALVQRCDDIKIANLITFGSPHMGVSELPLCEKNDWICKGRNAILKKQVWFSRVQRLLIPAQYFRDPKELDKYLKYSNFLADINNERDSINKTYSERLSKLENLVLIEFLKDTTLVPKESSKFFDRSANGEIIDFNQTRIYQQERLGLKSLYETNRIEFLSIDADHMDIPVLFVERIAKKYIGSII